MTTQELVNEVTGKSKKRLTSKDKKQLTIRLDPGVHKDLKVYAAARGTTVQRLVLDSINTILSIPPVSDEIEETG